MAGLNPLPASEAREGQGLPRAMLLRSEAEMFVLQEGCEDILQAGPSGRAQFLVDVLEEICRKDLLGGDERVPVILPAIHTEVAAQAIGRVRAMHEHKQDTRRQTAVTMLGRIIAQTNHKR